MQEMPYLQRGEIGGTPALDGLLKGRLVVRHLEEALLLLHIHLPGRPVRPLELRLVSDKLGLVCLNLRPACFLSPQVKGLDLDRKGRICKPQG